MRKKAIILKSIKFLFKKQEFKEFKQDFNEKPLQLKTIKTKQKITL